MSPEYSPNQFNNEALRDQNSLRLTPDIPEQFMFEPLKEANLVAVIQAYGEEIPKNQESDIQPNKLALVDIRGIKAVDGVKEFNGIHISADVEYMLLDENPDFKNGTGFKGLRKNESFTYGRPVDETNLKDPKNRFKTSGTTSRNHFNIKITEEGLVDITDLNSTNGTRVYKSEKIGEAIGSPEVTKKGDVVKELGETAVTASAEVKTVFSTKFGEGLVDRQKRIFAPPIEQTEADAKETDFDALFDPNNDMSKKSVADAAVESTKTRSKTESSVIHSKNILASPALNRGLVNIIREAGINIADPDSIINSVGNNADLRNELAGYFLDQIAKNYNIMPKRIQDNGQKNTNHPGYDEPNISSREYAAVLALSYIDGTFDPDKSDIRVSNDEGEVIIGQHRAAAELLIFGN